MCVKLESFIGLGASLFFNPTVAILDILQLFNEVILSFRLRSSKLHLSVEMSDVPVNKIKHETDYKLCIKCQSYTNLPFVKQPEDDSYSKFLLAVHERAQYADTIYPQISRRLIDITAVVLKEKGAKWHIKCYSNATNRTDINRAKARYEQLCNSEKDAKLQRKSDQSHPVAGGSSVKTMQITRSKVIPFKKELCLFFARRYQGLIFTAFLHIMQGVS